LALAFSCVVLVGGKSRRFGSDKALAEVQGQPLVVRIADRLRAISDDVMLVGNRLERFAGVSARLVPDEIGGLGVVSGLVTSLHQARYPYVFLGACDMPFVDPAVVCFLVSLAEGYDVVMPQLGGILQPMHAVYGKPALPAIGRLVAAGDACPLNFLPEIRLRTVSEDEIKPIDSQLRSFFNVNKRRDWEQMQRILDPGSMVSNASDPIEKEKHMNNKLPVISVVGKSNVGKTTLLEKLLPELKRRGYRVATIKHDAHHFELDTPGKDTWRHAQAGSDCVVISSAEKLAMIQKVEGELTLDDIVAQLPAVDVVLTEGYKRQDKPKIEVSRREMGSQLLCTRDELICLATDQPFDMDVPQFDLNDAVGIVDLVEKRFLQR
jgi:molybdopterin-guanine dinucleotide biosynthesis protein